MHNICNIYKRSCKILIYKTWGWKYVNVYLLYMFTRSSSLVIAIGCKHKFRPII